MDVSRVRQGYLTCTGFGQTEEQLVLQDTRWSGRLADSCRLELVIALAFLVAGPSWVYTPAVSLAYLQWSVHALGSQAYSFATRSPAVSAFHKSIALVCFHTDGPLSGPVRLADAGGIYPVLYPFRTLDDNQR